MAHCTIPPYQAPETLASPDVMIDGKIVIPTVSAPEIDLDQIEDCIVLADQAARYGEPFGTYVVRHVTGQQIVDVVRKVWGKENTPPQSFIGSGRDVHSDYTNLERVILL